MKEFNKIKDKINSSLSGSRFRQINQQLYTTSSKNAFQLFKQEPELFELYHSGYQQMVKQWPVHPQDIIIRLLKTTKLTSILLNRHWGLWVWNRTTPKGTV